MGDVLRGHVVLGDLSLVAALVMAGDVSLVAALVGRWFRMALKFQSLGTVCSRPVLGLSSRLLVTLMVSKGLPSSVDRPITSLPYPCLTCYTVVG